MEFRWVALIALWTLLSGPAFNMPNSGPRPVPNQNASGSFGEQKAQAAVPNP